MMTQPPKRPFMAERQMAQRAGERFPDAPSPQHETVSHSASDSAAILAAIRALDSKLDQCLSGERGQIDRIQADVADMAGRITATKLEMAALRHPLAEDDLFEEASSQLSSIVYATEAATHIILGAAEEIQDIVNETRNRLPDLYAQSRLGDLNEIALRIFETCNFQDLTGQRITKAVNALTFIEERISAMLSLWNQKEFEAMPMPPGLARQDGGLTLHGPSADAPGSGRKVTQDEIDALFD
jgi:chemotaxis protein CheZ